MGRLLLALLIGLVGAAVVHISVIFAIPRVAENNAFARLSRVTSPFEPGLIHGGGAAAPAGPSRARFAFMDPAFLTAACRFSLSDGPVQLEAGEPRGFWSASLHARGGDNLYGINERLAPGRRLDLLVGTADQLEELRAEGVLDSEDAILVPVAASELYLTMRVLASHPSERAQAEAYARSLSCRPLGANASAPQVSVR